MQQISQFETHQTDIQQIVKDVFGTMLDMNVEPSAAVLVRGLGSGGGGCSLCRHMEGYCSVGVHSG